MCWCDFLQALDLPTSASSTGGECSTDSFSVWWSWRGKLVAKWSRQSWSTTSASCSMLENLDSTWSGFKNSFQRGSKPLFNPKLIFAHWLWNYRLTIFLLNSCHLLIGNVFEFSEPKTVPHDATTIFSHVLCPSDSLKNTLLPRLIISVPQNESAPRNLQKVLTWNANLLFNTITRSNDY